MKTRRVVEGSLGAQVREDGRVAGGGQPLVRVGAENAVLSVGVRPSRCGRRRAGRASGVGGHGRHRTAGRLLIAAGLVLASLVPGLAAGGPAAAKSRVVFHVAMLGESVDSLNPFVGIQAPSYEMWGLTYDYLVGYSMTDMSPAPALATNWTTSSDGKTWTFTVRKGVKFSDGVPLTANDVAYTLNRALHGKTEQASWISYLNGVTGITAPNATTVVLKLKQPSATLPLLPIPIVPEHVWKHVSESDVKTYSAAPSDGQPVVGEGPFRLVEGTANGDTFKFEANPDYWRGAPHIDEVIFQFYKNDDSAIQAMLKGEVDFVEGITALEVKHLQSQAGVTAHNGNSPGFEEIAFNTGSVDTKTGKPIGNPNPAMLDPKFRHALGYAVNLPQLIQKVYQGAGLPGTTIIPPSYKRYHWEPPPGQKMTFDLAKAGQLLDAAGYKKGPDGLRTMPDGKPIGTLRLDARSDSTTSLNAMDYFKSWLSQLGIKAQVSTPSSNQLTDIILKGNFDAFYWGWFVEPDPDSMLSYMTCGQRTGWSDSWFCNKQYDTLYREQHVQTDPAKRAAEVKQMQQILYEQSPYLVTAYDTVGEAVRSDHFACFVPQPNPGGIWLEQYGVYNYIHMKPAAQAGNCGSATGGGHLKEAVSAKKSGASTSIGMPFILGGAGLVGVVLVALAVMAVRRRITAGDRE
jgi:peptide/nickel transport system substrate-binding protein